MKKAKVEKEILLCGCSEKKIRKAYFKNELEKLLNDIQAENKYSESDIEKLAFYLSTLKKENSSVRRIVSDKIGDINLDTSGKPPTVEELSDGSNDDEWREKADDAINYVQKQLDAIRTQKSNDVKVSSNFWFNVAITFLSYEDLITKDLAYKEQLYRKRLTTIIDKNGVSRKEAEERAKLTREYFDYTVLNKLFDRLKEFYTFARRGDDRSNQR